MYTAGSPSTIGLVDSGGGSVEVQLAEKTQLIFTKTYGSPNFEIANPGLQYLAVYETEPVESLLDIFWETSTSGLISNLNTAVLNSQNTPGAIDIGGWNDDSFLESLPDTVGNHDILNGPFVLEDDFGITINLNTTRVIDGVPTPDYLYLTSVTNGLGENVSNQFNSAGGKDYFRLVDTSPGQIGEGPWNIRTTTSADTPISSDNYYDNIYHFPNENGQLFNREREFVFLFTARIDGLVTQLPLQFANLSNVFPIVQEVIDEVNTITYTLPINDVDINANRRDNTLATIFATNGADNPNLFNGLIGGEVSNNLSFSIQSQIYLTGPSAGEPAVLEDSNIFSLTEKEVDAGNGFLKCQLKNDAFESSYLSSAEYQIVVAVQDGDGGGITTQTFIIDMRLIVEQDKVYNAAMRAKAKLPYVFPDNPDFNSNLGQELDNISFTYTQFELDANTVGIAPAEVGWYIYADGFLRIEAPVQGIEENPGSTGSRPLINFNGADENVPIVIPFTQAKKAILFGDGTGVSFRDYRYIAPEATVEITNITAQPNGDVIVAYDPATLTGIISTYQSAWGISDADRSGPGAFFPGYGALGIFQQKVLVFGAKYVLANDTANSQLTLTGINSQANIGDTLYLYQGFKREDSFPWYFVPYAAGLAGLQQTFAASPYTSWAITKFELPDQPNPSTPQSGPGNFSEPADGVTYGDKIHHGLFTNVDSSPDITGINFDIT